MLKLSKIEESEAPACYVKYRTFQMNFMDMVE